MAYDWEDSEPSASRSRTVSGVVRALASYALFALGIAALASFFAPFVGVPELAWHSGVLPTIAAPTEQESRFVDVAPLILGVVVSSLAVWLR